jgi:hypothetical protein
MDPYDQAIDLTTLPTTLDRLAGDADWRVRLAVARHPATPSATLDRLAVDATWWVRRAVADNPATRAATLDQLAADVDWLMRYDVGKHPNTPVATLLRLAEDKNPNVRRAARSHEAFDGVLSWKQAMLWVAVGCLVLAVVVML